MQEDTGVFSARNEIWLRRRMVMSVQTHELFYPMLAMFVWTFLILLRNVQVRVVAVLKGELTNEYFELFRGSAPSDLILKTQNHLRNLMEIPPAKPIPFFLSSPGAMS